jgi:4-amino-4-deoxy-L-arabinose transferase-like glycosyltransferase
VLIVLLTADMVAILGGGRGAQVLGAIVVAVGPVFIAISGLMTMDSFDQLWWTLCAWTLLRMIKNQQPRLWLLFGLFAGLGLFTKLVIGFYIVSLVIGLLLSNQRKLLFNRWLVFGGLIAFLFLSPYILWNATHGFSTLEFTSNYASGKTFQATPLEFLGQQIVTLNPLAFPLWLGALCFLFFTATGKPYRAFGWAYLLLFMLFMLQKTKFYWLSPAYPALIAVGAYALGLLGEQRPRLRWLQPAYIWTIAISGLLFVPFAIPILPVQTFIQINHFMGGASNIQTENLATSALPQNYADRYGWPEMVQAVKQAYDTLTPEEKAEACIYTSNYGEAGAVDLFGPALGLPKAISGHNSYFLWGPQGCSGKVLITVNVPKDDLVSGFDSVQLAGSTACTYCMPYENNAPIFIARGLHAPIKDVWPTVKSYN